MGRLPTDKQLDINDTFENQKEKVNKHIIPVVQKAIKNQFSVTDGIIKHIVHERHRHQREHVLNKSRSTGWNDTESRRKHANSRCTDVSKNQVVYYFIFLIKLFYRNENVEKERLLNWSRRRTDW